MLDKLRFVKGKKDNISIRMNFPGAEDLCSLVMKHYSIGIWFPAREMMMMSYLKR